jgi:tRNA (cmo5U34)-methyltransferase
MAARPARCSNSLIRPYRATGSATNLSGRPIMIGVLHHLPGEPAKREIMEQLATRLKPGAPLILAGNYRTYASEPILMAAWAARWRMHGAGPDEVRAKMDKILEGAEPPRSEEEVAVMLAKAGFEMPLRFFASLFWGAWLSRRASAR